MDPRNTNSRHERLKRITSIVAETLLPVVLESPGSFQFSALAQALQDAFVVGGDKTPDTQFARFRAEALTPLARAVRDARAILAPHWDDLVLTYKSAGPLDVLSFYGELPQTPSTFDVYNVEVPLEQAALRSIQVAADALKRVETKERSPDAYLWYSIDPETKERLRLLYDSGVAELATLLPQARAAVAPVVQVRKRQPAATPPKAKTTAPERRPPRAHGLPVVEIAAAVRKHVVAPCLFYMRKQFSEDEEIAEVATDWYTQLYRLPLETERADLPAAFEVIDAFYDDVSEADSEQFTDIFATFVDMLAALHNMYTNAWCYSRLFMHPRTWPDDPAHARTRLGRTECLPEDKQYAVALYDTFETQTRETTRLVSASAKLATKLTEQDPNINPAKLRMMAQPRRGAIPVTAIREQHVSHTGSSPDQYLDWIATDVEFYSEEFKANVQLCVSDAIEYLNTQPNISETVKSNVKQTLRMLNAAGIFTPVTLRQNKTRRRKHGT